MELVSTSDVCEYLVATMKPSEAVKKQFESLLQPHGGIIRKVAFGYARNESDRKDLMQDILLQLWKAYPRYSPDRPFSTWMYRIALNVSISYLRKHSRPGREMVRFDELQHDIAPEQSISPEMEERLTILRQLMMKYPPLDRALLLLYLDDRSYREIAYVLGLTETNVATKLSRLRERLRNELTDYANN
jgi:RNA polymerase sigma-70 factor (ECF subfamily)